MLEDKLEQDIKSALLSKDTERATALRTLKAGLLNIKVATGKRDSGLSDEEVIKAFAKEAKKRQESADLYIQGGNQDMADKELREKALIESYLPAQLSEDEISKIIDEVIAAAGPVDASSMGRIIGQVKSQLGATADGGVIARLTKEKLQ
ncbi:MAG TPA: GatB/YqeY domain-containing protein [Candidatus Saccharimonadales bacterium]|nr:GatB/YqeY domain-containing protein [Candidatus Saccharimonadales bacterium]